MTIPDFQSLMLSLLRSLDGGSEGGTRETLDALAEQRSLTEADDPGRNGRRNLTWCGWLVRIICAVS
jgi:hypothetical protein